MKNIVGPKQEITFVTTMLSLFYSILNFNKSFLALLHSRLRELGPDASIGDLFIGMVS